MIAHTCKPVNRYGACCTRGVWRGIVVVLSHLVTVVVALISTGAYQYFKVTGSTLDSDFVLFSLSSTRGWGMW